MINPTQASILTGRNIWQNEEAGVHISLFPKKFQVLPDILVANGYHVGVTGKGWAPGNWKDQGWPHNSAGPGYYQYITVPPTEKMSEVDYAANFKTFLKERKDGQPFYFWFGGSEPHRGYEYGSGLAVGKKLTEVKVPPFLLDDSVTRMDILDYSLEIEYFDHHLGRMLAHLEEIGGLDNTQFAHNELQKNDHPNIISKLQERPTTEMDLRVVSRRRGWALVGRHRRWTSGRPTKFSTHRQILEQQQGFNNHNPIITCYSALSTWSFSSNTVLRAE